MLHANDLIWSFVVNSYLLGKDRFPLEQLHWNADSTRMPTALHQFYVENFYQANKLCQPGGVALAGVDIDISRVKLPCYFLATIEDHIAPWKSAYRGAQLPGGARRFVLGGSGHLAGTINPPAARQHGYWTNDRPPCPKGRTTSCAAPRGTTVHGGPTGNNGCSRKPTPILWSSPASRASGP
jgi:polyhydroxyalkanoate synthase